MKYTVVGGSGFIGSSLLAHLTSQEVECYAPARDDLSIFGQDLGHVIYCAGVTADFRNRPADTVRAHVSSLLDLLEKARYDSFLYLSSTRVYQGAEGASETQSLTVDSQSPGDLYNLSKLMGESVCLSMGKGKSRIVRLSNVYGRDLESSNFLTSIIQMAIHNRHVVLSSHLDSEKDYVSIQDVVRMLPRIACSGRHQIYNLASGSNVSHRRLVDKLRDLTSCQVSVKEAAELVTFPRISIERIQGEFQYHPSPVLDDLEALVRIYSKGQHE